MQSIANRTRSVETVPGLAFRSLVISPVRPKYTVLAYTLYAYALAQNAIHLVYTRIYAVRVYIRIPAVPTLGIIHLDQDSGLPLHRAEDYRKLETENM